MIPQDMMMVGGSALSSGFIDSYFSLNLGHIYPVLICLLDLRKGAFSTV